MAVKQKDIDLSVFDSAVKSAPKKNGADIDLSVFDATVKKKEDGATSGESSQSISPSNSFLRSQQTTQPLTTNFREDADKVNQNDWSDVEASIKGVRDKYDLVQSAKSSTIQAGATPGGGYVPVNNQLTGTLTQKANQEYDVAKKNNDALLKQKSNEIYKPVKDLIETGKYKDFFDASGNFKYNEASQYLDGIVKANKGGQYLRDQLAVALKQAGQYKLDEPLRNKYRDEEYKKAGIDVSKYGENVFNKVTAVQRGNLDLLEAETKQKGDQYLNTNIKPQALKIGNEFTEKQKEIQEQVASGQMQPDVAQEQIVAATKKYKAEIAALNKFYQDGIRDINVKAQSKFARIDKEMKSIAAGITGEDVLRSIPDDIKKKIADADARVEARIQGGKNEARKVQDAILGALPGNQLGNLFTKSVVNGWYSGLSNIGQYLGMKGFDNGLTDYLKSKQYDADVTQPGQYEYGNGETINRIVTGTGSSLGASAPILLPSVALTLGTGGLGLPEVGSAIAGGLLSYEGEKAQNTGEVYKQMMEQTGDSQKAYEAAARYEERQKVMMPLYFLEGASFINLIKGGTLKKALIGQAQELAQELPTEYWQNYTQAQEVEGYKGDFGKYIKENPETAIDVITSTIGQGAIMSAGGKIFQAFNKNIPQGQAQYYTDMVGRQGVEFAQENLQKQFNTGVIDDNQLQQGMATIQRASEKLGQLAQVDIKDDAAKNYIVLSDTANQLADNAAKTKDEGLKIVYEKKLEETQKEMESAAGGQERYVILKNPGGSGGTKVIPIQQVESLRKSGMLDQMIQMSDGVEVKGDEALHKELVARKAELGNPANAPEGMYNDIEAKDVEEKPTEAERPIIDRVKEYGGEGIQRTMSAHESEGKHTEAMDFLKEQSLDAPNALKKQLGMRKNLTTDIIAENSPTEIDEALRKQEDLLYKELKNKSENKDPRVLKEIEQHISLLEEGLEKAQKKLSPTEKTETNESSTPKVETHESVMKRAKTGSPIDIKALRIQKSDEGNTKTGVFFGDTGIIDEYKKREAEGFYGPEAKGRFSGDVKQYDLSFENPLVITSKEEFIKQLAEKGDKEAIAVMPNFKEDDIAKLETTHKTHEEFDEFVAKKARELGHDGIIEPLEYIALSKESFSNKEKTEKPKVRVSAEQVEAAQPKEKSEEVKKEKPLSAPAKKMSQELRGLLGEDALLAMAADVNPNSNISLGDLGIKEGDTFKTIAERMADYKGEFEPLLKVISGLAGIENLKVRNVTQADFDKYGEGFQGGYVRINDNPLAKEEDKGTLVINPDAKNQYYTLTHEMMHWLTLDNFKISEIADKKKLETLEDIYNILNKEYKGRKDTFGGYGLTNFREFLAEVMINPKLREEVGSIVANDFENFRVKAKFSKDVKSFGQVLRDFINDLIDKIFGTNEVKKSLDFNKPLIENAAEIAKEIFLKPNQSGESVSIGDNKEQLAALNDASNKKIKDFVKDKLAAGESEDDIKEALRDNGLTEKEVESFFKKPIRAVVGNPVSKPTDIIDDYALTTSDKVNDFLSGKTLENIFGESPDGNQEYAVQKLSDMLQDGRNMIAIAQSIWGGDVASYGKPLFEYIQSMNNDSALTNKKAVLLATFLGEIKEEAFRNPDIRAWLSPLENEVEGYYQRFMNQKGKELAAGRLLRLYRDKYLGDIFADRILEDEQIRQKNAIRDSLGRKVDDDVAAKPSRDRSGQKIQKADKTAQAKKPSLSQQDAQTKAENKLKDLEDRLGKKPKETLIDKITTAIKKINCK